jgi:hypothetical protein
MQGIHIGHGAIIGTNALVTTETAKTSPAPDEVIFFVNENYSGKAYLAKLGGSVYSWKEYLSLHKLNSVKVGFM